MNETHDLDAVAPASDASQRPPRGFLLIVVAAMAALAGVISMGQWSQASSVARTGTTMMANVKARAIADVCLEQWLRYAKDGVDNANWSDFDELLNQQATGNVEVDDFIPPVADCTSGVAYVPKSTAVAAEPTLGYHRYCAIRMDDGVCLVRFDDNSDDGKTSAALSPPDADEAAGAASGDNPRKDTDFSVIVTAIGLFPAKGGTPPNDLYEQADARSTKRALIQIERQASPSGWPAIHARDDLTLVDGPGVGVNWAVTACGAGGVSAGGTVSRNGPDDGCVCGYHAIGAQPVLSGDDGSCTLCGAFTCATGTPALAPKFMDTNGVDDDMDWVGGGAGVDGEFDQDQPPPIPPHPSFTNIVAPGYAFANSFNTQIVDTTNVPAHVTGSAANPICTYFFGGAHNGDITLFNLGTFDATYGWKATPPVPAGRYSPPGRGRIYMRTGQAPGFTPGCSHRPVGPNTTADTCNTMGTVTNIISNTTPRIAYIWDHSDDNVEATFTTLADMYDGANAYTGAAGSPNALFGNTGAVAFGNVPAAGPGTLDINSNGLNDDWPVAPVNCETHAAPSLPEPCDWEITKNASGDIIGAHINLNSCQSLYSMCWRPVAVFDNSDGQSFLSPTLAGGAERESTDVHGEEAFQPFNGIKVPLVKATADRFAGAASPPYERYQDFCGQALGPGAYSTTLNDNGVFYDSAAMRWSILQHDIDFDEWPQRGTYWIFNNEGDAASRALDIANRLGGNGGRLKVGIIVDGAFEMSADDHEICCPTCSCNNGPLVDPQDLVPPMDIQVQKEIYSPGYAFFAREGCYLDGRPLRLNGDILCRYVGINRNANDPERIFSDVFGTGSCQSGTCSPTPTALGNLPSWCGETGFNGSPWVHYGICMKEKTSDASAIGSKGPWVGYVWTRGDMWIGVNNAIAAPRAVDPQLVPPALYRFPLPNHPEWPTLYSEDDLGIGTGNRIYGKVQSATGPGGADMYIGTSNQIYGRVVAEGDLTFKRQNEIYWSGQGTTVTAVGDKVFYQDLGW
jgi:hypothetical protein